VPVVGQHGPDKTVPPDAPPTVYEPYPSPYRVPTSFRHPVTDTSSKRVNEERPMNENIDIEGLEKQVTGSKISRPSKTWNGYTVITSIHARCQKSPTCFPRIRFL
jgi:hypothetical protein